MALKYNPVKVKKSNAQLAAEPLVGKYSVDFGEIKIHFDYKNKLDRRWATHISNKFITAMDKNDIVAVLTDTHSEIPVE